MQQQLEGGVTLGGVDLEHEAQLANQIQAENFDPMNMEAIQEQNLGFVPLKNLMPKTTGSQAHLLNIQQQQQEAASAVAAGLSGCVSGNVKSFNSLNQTGRTANSANRNAPSFSHQGASRKNASRPVLHKSD